MDAGRRLLRLGLSWAWLGLSWRGRALRRGLRQTHQSASSDANRIIRINFRVAVILTGSQWHDFPIKPWAITFL